MQLKNTSSLSEIALFLEQKVADSDRFILAIAGAPGSGKSTLACELQQALTSINPLLSSQIVAMDGFHLDNVTLTNNQQLPFKGAPHTFDVNGFSLLLARLKKQQNEQQEIIFAPFFNRDIEEVIPNAVPISIETKIIIVEGNYLLLQQPPWDQLVSYFDCSLFIKSDKAILEQRLTQRWLDQGFDLANAQCKTRENDLVNADLVELHSGNSDIVFTQ